MNTLRKWTPISCALLSIAAYSVAITCSAEAQSESKMMLLKSAPHKVQSGMPAPSAGIKLIEYISSRMHTMKGNLIAAKKATYSAEPQEQSQGPTNKMLALRPPVSGYTGARDLDRESSSDKKSANEEQKSKRKSDDGRNDKLAMADEAGHGSYIGAGTLSRRQISVPLPAGTKKEGSSAIVPASTSASRAESASNVYGRMANGPLAKSLANLGGALQQIDSVQHAAEGGGKDVARARTKSLRPEVSYQIASSKGVSGVWETPVRGSFLPQQAQQGAGFSSNVKDARLSNASGAGVAGDATVQEPQSPPRSPLYYRTTYNRLPSANMGKYVNQPGDNQYSSSTAGGAGGANVREYRNSQIASNSIPAAAPSLQAAQMAPPPLQSQSANSQTIEDGVTQNAHFNAFQKQKTEIAMLPPNVITGIPLVRLGSSALEANKALTSIKGNKLKQQSISGWTVYVLHKANSPEPAMQVYVRHGLVEALRIFDNAFIAPDFGVQLNDDVSTVKAKFGEPTFMCAEPDCPSAKNYVYPISQVSFELTWPHNAPTPKVVSVLIFTVK